MLLHTAALRRLAQRVPWKAVGIAIALTPAVALAQGAFLLYGELLLLHLLLFQLVHCQNCASPERLNCAFYVVVGCCSPHYLQSIVQNMGILHIHKFLVVAWKWWE